jgi:hypothetical protein
MIGKIAQAIKAAISPTKPPRPAIEYFDQAPPRIMHSSFEAQHQPQDGWVNAAGRYRTDGWFNKR